jgi:hypothetical protein
MLNWNAVLGDWESICCGSMDSQDRKRAIEQQMREPGAQRVEDIKATGR